MSIREFRLSEKFIEDYKEKKVEWGPLGEVVYLRTYSRKIDGENRNERWFETVRRVVEGIYNVQKDHCSMFKLPWDNHKSQKSAQIMYDKIFNFKFLPPGRGLWMMGTEFVKEKGSAALNNCGFISTDDIENRHSFAFTWLMDALMLGVGVGFDTKGANKISIKEPKPSDDSLVFKIPDSREGWTESVQMLMDAYFFGRKKPQFDYSGIRPYGAPIGGFGGVASGPEPLETLHKSIEKLLDTRVGEKITSTDIVDLMNFIGVCVVAGNVRRCLPEGATVHARKGLQAIESLEVGDEVLTSKGYKPIKNLFHQGVQGTLRIKTQDGFFECTPNHRMAVMTSVGEYVWKEASSLVQGDRLVSTTQSIEGTETCLPGWSYEKPEHSTTCRDITVPELDLETAWLIGLLQGDGYVYPNRKQDGFNAYVSIVFHSEDENLALRAKKALERFGTNVSLSKRKKENSIIVRTQSKQLAWYFDGFIKQANTTMVVPNFIKIAKEDIKLAYISGLLDSDGSVKTSPTNVVTSVYGTFVKELQTLLYSCGVQTRLKFTSRKHLENWQDIWQLNLINLHSQNKIKKIPTLYKKLKEKSRSQNSNSYPSEWVTENKRLLGVYGNKNVTFDTYNKHTKKEKQFLVPVEVLGIEEGRKVLTYDIEVEDVHEFFVEGYLTHNSAEIAVGEADDKDYRIMKDYNLFSDELQSHRWASNNSVFAHVGETDYHALAESISVNGEPGIIWLDNIRKYGRTSEEPNWDDEAAVGVNPSLRKGTKVITSNGIFPIEELEGKEIIVNNLNGVQSSAKCFLSGKNKQLYKLSLEGGHEYYCTPEHKWPVLQKDGSYIKKETTEIKSGDWLPLIKNDKLFDGGIGTEEEGFFFGYNMGDGWITTRGDNGKTQIGFVLNKEDYNSEVKTKLVETLSKYSDANFNKRNNGTYELNTQNDLLTQKFEEYGFTNKKDGIPKFVFENASEEFRKGFIDGLFTSDGYVDVNDNRIGLVTAHEKLAKDFGELLGFYGIKVSISSKTKKDVIFPNGKSYDKEYTMYSVRIGESKSLEHFIKLFNITNIHKNENLKSIYDKSRGYVYENNVKILNVELTDIYEDVWDITVYDNTHCFQLSHCVTGNCGEQTLENTELCVSGDTRIQTKNGIPMIKDVIGKEVEIWNGDKWSKVVPFETGELETFRVHLSDGSYLDATKEHGWHVKPKNKRVYRRVNTKDLEIGSKSIEYSLGHFEGINDPYAFELGLFVGDGYIDGKRSMVCVHGDKIKLQDLDVNGVWYKPQILEGYKTPVNRLNISNFVDKNIALHLNDKTKGLPEYIFGLDKESILEFVSGWIETDGTIIKSENSEHYRIYSTEQNLRDLQLLLRRVNINHASIRKMANKGEETNFGIRNYDLYYLTIPSYECKEIPTRIKIIQKFGKRYKENNAYEDSKKIDSARKQKIVKIEPLGIQKTFCFNEVENNMGVFGNVLTYQCNLVETFPSRHENYDEYEETLKYAYLYAKSVTLIPTHWEETNQVMLKNRRIGTSQSGIIDAFVKHGRRNMLKWSDKGYKYLKKLDKKYSNWLCIPRSIKITTVKPSGTVSLLPGVSAGIHYPHSEYYIRRVRIASNSPLIEPLKKSGYPMEFSQYGSSDEDKQKTMVISFPVHEKYFVKKKDDVSIWEQMKNSVDYQRWWSDNNVSITITFNKNEVQDIATVLDIFEDELKAVSFLPIEEHGYAQAPYEEISEEEYKKLMKKIKTPDFSHIVTTPEGEKYCDSDHCDTDLPEESEKKFIIKKI